MYELSNSFLLIQCLSFVQIEELLSDNTDLREKLRDINNDLCKTQEELKTERAEMRKLEAGYFRATCEVTLNEILVLVSSETFLIFVIKVAYIRPASISTIKYRKLPNI